MARRHGRGRRGRRFGVLYKLLTLVVVCAAAVLALTLFFKVESVEVTGNSRYSAQEIQDACGVSLGDNLYLLSKPDMVQRLHQQLPYIDEVRITRQLPNTLCVQVTEFSTVYAVEQEGTVWLLTSGGKIVETAAERGDTPLIDGCELLAPSLGGDVSFALELQNRRESLFALLTALESAELTGDVRAIHLGDPTVLSMDYTERFTVEMPYGADYPRAPPLPDPGHRGAGDQPHRRHRPHPGRRTPLPPELRRIPAKRGASRRKEFSGTGRKSVRNT